MGKQHNGITRLIAVDGPSAAGKTTASTAIASELGLAYLESGRCYRIITRRTLDNSITLSDTSAVAKICDEIFGDTRLLTADERDTQLLRLPDVGRAVSEVAKIPGIRNKITNLIRAWADAHKPCIIEGRDIGTVVLPGAAVKFYLEASPEVRAQRRQRDEVGRSYAEVLQDILRRDHEDSSRINSPLRPAHDAIIFDTNILTIHEVLDKMLPTCRQIIDSG